MDLSALSMWVIYDHPNDMPEQVVARRHEVGGPIREPFHGPTGDYVTGDTVEAVRGLLPPGLHCMPRTPWDEPQIVEVWL